MQSMKYKEFRVFFFLKHLKPQKEANCTRRNLQVVFKGSTM